MGFYQPNPSFRDRRMLADDKGRELTYGEFDQYYEKKQMLFLKRGLMFLLCTNQMASVMLYLMCLRKGVVPLLLNGNLDEELLERLILTYKPDYLSLPQERAGRWKQRGREVLRDRGYVTFQLNSQERARLHPDLALLLMTSGSTGSPKLVRLSRRNLVSNARAIAGYLEITEKERPITSLPMNYTYGLSIINSHLEQGAAVYMTERSMAEEGFWRFFKEKEITSFGGVPFTYQMLKRIGFFEMELPSLRTMTQAGGKLSEGLQREFGEFAARTGRRMVVMYGQTEATARMSYLPAGDVLRKIGSIGISIPGGRFSLRDEEGRTITKAGQVGELIYEGPNVAMGYAGQTEELAEGDLWQGRLATGDMARQDEEGYYYITGRKKRFLKMYGKRVSLDEMEQLVRSHCEGSEAACTGSDDHMRIYITGNPDGEELCFWLSRKTGLHAGGMKVIYVDQIPKNQAGKILYQELERSQMK